MILQDNAGDNLTVDQNGFFQFPTQIAHGSQYDVSIFVSPDNGGYDCTVYNYSGVALTDITNVSVDCGHNDWTWMAGTNELDQYGMNTTPPPAPPLLAPTLPAVSNWRRLG